MAQERYDLTAKVLPFLDGALQEQVKQFNEGKAVSVPPNAASAGASEGSPSLAAAQDLYKRGEYAASSSMLAKLKTNANPASSDYEAIVWGKLASDLLAFPNPPTAVDSEGSAEGEKPKDEVLESLQGVQDLLDLRRGSDSGAQLLRRAWLIHWSLFAYFRGRLPILAETFFAPPYMSVIHAVCPHVLRYVAVSVILSNPRNARFNRRIKDLARVVQQEQYEYTDAVLDFVTTLLVDFNFADVAAKLQEAANLLKNDFFANELVDEFVLSARYLIADVFLRVHEYVSLGSLASVLGFTNDSEVKQFTEAYVKSNQEAKLDASYDAANNTVRLSYSKPSIFTQVSERVKSIDQRANQLLGQLQARQ